MSDSIDLLVLGGTSWLGGAVARLAQQRGHRVSCLARGESGSVPAGTTFVTADRRDTHAYEAVADRRWNAVLDVSWQPELVNSALAALAGRAQHWIYVSSVSVYQDGEVGEDRLHTAWTGTGEATIEDYPAAKVRCETLCRESMPAESLLIARAGLIAGYGDRSDRFGYWPARIADVASPNEAVLVPPVDNPLQVIDVEDLAGWLVDAVEERRAGTFDAVGDRGTIGEMLEACAATAVGRYAPTCVEADQEWLLSHGVVPWSGPESLPLWVPLPEHAEMMTRDNAAAKAAGLRLRPIEDTVASALAWEVEAGLDRVRKAGLSPERERDLLKQLLEGDK